MTNQVELDDLKQKLADETKLKEKLLEVTRLATIYRENSDLKKVFQEKNSNLPRSCQRSPRLRCE